MPFKKVEKLKKGDKFKAAIFTPKGVYISWVKVVSFDKLRYYNTGNPTWAFIKLTTYEVLSGHWKGKHISALLDDTWDVIIPEKPGKWLRIWKLLWVKEKNLEKIDSE